jgi:hypothetical protein
MGRESRAVVCLFSLVNLRATAFLPDCWKRCELLFSWLNGDHQTKCNRDCWCTVSKSGN